ncbi:MAG: S-adenosylmethionine:tRNA ribosyltransferase-isomerase, partial [Planctomycetes bacterium]|nr:S-adenosylmethionine:tRNA ribosyltransferase-isomerase [Planctomycetota bacterium]
TGLAGRQHQLADLSAWASGQDSILVREAFGIFTATADLSAQACQRAREFFDLPAVAVDGPRPADAVLEVVGLTPLPPYILRARGVRGDRSVDDAQDRSWYQTVYADPDQGRSVAAPTAGLHFTPELLQTLLGKGVERLEISLNIGPGTFKPITTPTLETHDMYWECYEVPSETLESLNAIQDRKKAGESGRLFAVGTTSVRTLESLPDPLPVHESLTGTTDLFIAPPYDFRFVDGLLTNFHLPRSTLLALVAALVGLERLLAVYEQAIREGYRFYSYGDAMLILP